MANVSMPAIPQGSKLVLDTLARNKAMSLVELMSELDLPDNEIEKIVKNLEENNFVRITEREKMDEIITIRQEGLRIAGLF